MRIVISDNVFLGVWLLIIFVPLTIAAIACLIGALRGTGDCDAADTDA